MHRTIEVTLLPAAADTLAAALQGLQHVVGVARQRGASVQPAGCDVIVVHALNRGTDAVMRAVAEAAARHGGPLSVATAELASLSDPEHQAAIDRDVDEALWEEMETGMRHQGRITANFLALMALGGAIAAAGLVSKDPVLQTIAVIAAAVLTPGFEPISKIPLGLVLRQFEVVKLGLMSSLAGYAVLAAGAAVAFLALWGFGAIVPDDFFAGPAAEHLAHPPAPDVLISFCGAVAGVVIQVAYRRSVIAGALIAMRIIDAAAAVGGGAQADRGRRRGGGADLLAADRPGLRARGGGARPRVRERLGQPGLGRRPGDRRFGVRRLCRRDDRRLGVRVDCGPVRGHLRRRRLAPPRPIAGG